MIKEITNEELDYTVLHHIQQMSTNNKRYLCYNTEIHEKIVNWIALNPEVVAKSRERRFVDQRQFICYLLRKHTHLPLRAIGVMIGNKNHATVLHGIRSHEALFSQKEPEYLYNNRHIIEAFAKFI